MIISYDVDVDRDVSDDNYSSMMMTLTIMFMM